MIAEVLYYIFIYPMQTLLGVVFEWIYVHTHSYGWAIVLLSVAINLFLLKLTNLADKKAQKTNTLKSICDAKIAEFKKVFRGSELHAYTQTLFKQKHYHPIYNLFSLGGLALQIPFFLGVLFLLQDFEGLRGAKFGVIEDLSKPDTLLFGYALLPFVMSALSFISVFISSTDRGAHIQGSLIAIIFLVLLYAMPSGLVLYWTISTLCILLKLLWRKRVSSTRNAKADTSLNNEQNKSAAHKEFDTHAKQSSFVGRFVTRIFTPYAMLDSKTYVTYRNISIIALLNIFFLIFVFSPFAVYSSDVSQFDPNQTFQTLGGLFGFFLLFSFLGIYITSFFYKTPLLKIGVYGVSVILCIGLVYTFIFTGDYGAMNHFVLEKLNFANPELRAQKYIQFFITFFGSIIVMGLVLRYLDRVWKFCFFVFFVVTLLYCFQIINATNNTLRENIMQDSTQTLFKPYENELFSYSKNDKNIVIFVLDMFSGSHTPYLFTQFSNLKEAFDGFVLYNNTISTSDSTIHSIPTLIGGEYYTTYNMNKRQDNLAPTITKAFGETALAFLENNYQVSYFLSVSSQGSQFIRDYVANKAFIMDDILLFQGYYYTSLGLEEKLDIKIQENKDATLLRLVGVGLFRFAPELFFRSRIYNSGSWFIQDYYIQNALTSIQLMSSLYAFTHIHNTNADKPTFKYLHTLATHTPYGMFYDHGNCTYFSRETIWNNTEAAMTYLTDQDREIYYQHYDTEACALSYIVDFIQWLKNEGIYDNTQIFIISDHGGSDSINVLASRSDALLLFKDFNSKGALKTDSRLMANYDIASIFCENLPQGCKNVGKNILKNYPKNREIIHTAPISWMLESHKKDQWILRKAYRVKDNIYNPKNWQEVDPKTFMKER
ncbi:YidC/Oxa1 family membrane protein insertase [uncultured Helicobacter sp.]|uniref:YidC/Oxa1 family membrane protein insertase n=1 Tax=uncultured Helicobacter sp. TaxID=175537 RepID=UPI00374F920E